MVNCKTCCEAKLSVWFKPWSFWFGSDSRTSPKWRFEFFASDEHCVEEESEDNFEEFSLLLDLNGLN